MRTEDGYFVCKCLDGDSAAFGFLVEKYKNCVYALAYSRLRNVHDAQDVAQEVFIKTYKNLYKFRNWESIRAWLYVTTSNECKMWLRSQSRRPDKEFIEDQNTEALESPSIDSYRNDIIFESLYKALDSLPDIYRDVLTLYYLGDMDGEDISKFLGITHSAVRQRLSRARERLKEEMVDMTGESLAQQRLQSSFTFRIVEMVKRIRIHPISTMKGLPWGLSLATGILFTVLSINPYISHISQMDILSGSPLPSETKVLKIGEIPVDVVKTSNIAISANKAGKDTGRESKLVMQNALFMATQGEGGKWEKKADMPTARDGLSTGMVNGKIYAIGGRSINDVTLKTVEEYDPVKDTWTTRAGMPTKRAWLSTSFVGGKIYAIGGGNWPEVKNSLSAVEVYDPTTDTWAKCSDMQTRRWGHSTCVVNGKIYVVGGADTFGPLISTVEEYDPVKDIWTNKADMPTARFALSACAVNGIIYTIGGGINIQARDSVPTVEAYNPATNEWTKKADMPTARLNFPTCVVNGKIYAIGGQISGDIVTNIVEEYDPETDIWTEKAHMPTLRGFMSASIVDGKIYAFGGYGIQDILSTVEEYTPEGWPFASKSISPQGKMPKTWGTLKAR